MFLGRKRLDDKAADDRQKLLAYKKVFGTEEGKEVLFDLCNRYRVLDSCTDQFHEGGRRVVVDILKRCNINIAEFDKLLRGEI